MTKEEKQHNKKCIHYGNPLLANGDKCTCDCHSENNHIKTHNISVFPFQIGMSLKQSKLVNDLIVTAHNNGVDETIKFLDT